MQQSRAPGGRGSGPSSTRARSSRARTPARPGGAPRGATAPGGSAQRGTTAPGGPGQRTVAAGAAAQRARAPRQRRFTGRAAVLGLLLLGLLLAYAYPVRVFMAQQAEIAALHDQQERQRKTIDSLVERRAKWDDEAYIVAQARRRLHYVLPGELPYVVIGGQAGAPGAGTGGPSPEATRPTPWYGKLWSSVETADRGVVEPE